MEATRKKMPDRSDRISNKFVNHEKKLQAEAESMVAAGEMPTLEELTAAILEVRREYRLQILRARREAREAREAERE